MAPIVGLFGVDAEEGVGRTLFSDSSCRAVARIHPEVVSEGENFSPNSLDQSGMIPAREIGSPHRPAKKGISCEYRAVSVKTNPARRMSGRMDNRYAVGSQTDLLPFIEVSVRLEAQPRSIRGMDQDGGFGNPSYLLSRPGVVEMAVRDEDVLNF